MTGSDLEDALVRQLEWADLPAPERQYRLLTTRKFRWDLAWPDHLLAVEVDGGTWTGGRHVRGSGVEADSEKQCLAAVAGWRTMRVTGRMIDTGLAVDLIGAALAITEDTE